MLSAENLTLTYLFDEGRLSRRTLNVLSAAGFDNLKSLQEAAARGLSFRDLKGLGSKSVREVERLLNASLFDEDGKSVDDNSPEALYRRLTDLQRQVLDVYYETFRAGLSSRALNFMDAHGITLERLLPLMGQPLKRYSNLCPGRFMKKSLSEIHTLAERTHAELRLVGSMDSRQVRFHCIRQRFPFLFGPSRRLVAEFYATRGHVPLFHVMEQYLHYSLHRSDRIFRLVRGLSGEPRTTVALGAEYGITPERVRQLAESGPQMLREPWFRRYDILTLYAGLFAEGYIANSPDSPLEQVLRDEEVTADIRSFMRLCALLTGWDISEYGPHVLLVSPTLQALAPGHDILTTLCMAVERRRSVPEAIGVTDLIQQEFAGADTLALAPTVRRICLEMLGCSETADGGLLLPRTHVDVARECYEILAETGTPMHIEDLFAEFKRRYPEHKFTCANQLRRMLWSDSRIRPVGKQSKYGLAEWDHIYFGSIRDLLCDCLGASDRPMTVDELYDCVRTHYPDTTPVNIYATMSGDRLHRFVQYEEGFGLAGKDYPGATPRRRQ